MIYSVIEIEMQILIIIVMAIKLLFICASCSFYQLKRMEDRLEYTCRVYYHMQGADKIIKFFRAGAGKPLSGFCSGDEPNVKAP